MQLCSRECVELLHKDFSKIRKAEFELQTTAFPLIKCSRFEIVDNHLWCIEVGTCKVRVFEKTGKDVDELHYPEMKEIENGQL